jgi:hypothetical protein
MPASASAIAPAMPTGMTTSGADLGAAAALIGADYRATESTDHHPDG